MIETVAHQLRYVYSLVTGQPFAPGSLEQLVASIRATVEEFGSIGVEGVTMLNGPELEADTARELQCRRFRAVAKRAAAETTYYRDLFARLGVNPDSLTYEAILQLPLTRKEAVRDHSDQFVVRSARPFLRATTTGTTGLPTSIHFSLREMRVFAALTALSALANQTILPDDIVQVSTNARGLLGTLSLGGALAHIGVLVYQTGVIDPAIVLALLAQERQITGKQSRASIFHTYPSCLGALVEHGLANGYKPADFALRRINLGGEIVTQGLKERAKALFGEVVYDEGYGITELWPLGGTHTPDGLLRFEFPHGLVEVINPQTEQPAAPGEIGTLVGTPFPPFRESTLLLRYDTEDLVRVPLNLTPRTQITGNILGKKRLAIQHRDGWTTPRAVMEVLEAQAVVPLPARFSLHAVEDGVGIEVVTRQQSSAVRQVLTASLEQANVPLKTLQLCASPRELTRPFPLRGDLREQTFSVPPPESIGA